MSPADVSIKCVPINWTVQASLPASSLSVLEIGGTFTYDAATNQITDWYIHNGGFFDLGTLFQSTASCAYFCDLSSASTTDGEFLYTFTHFAGTLENSLTLALAFPLTGQHDSVELIPGSSSDAGSVLRTFDILAPPGTGMTVRVLSGSVTETPEPELGLCIGLILLSLASVARYKRSPPRGVAHPVL